jgi:hypothetical protein
VSKEQVMGVAEWILIITIHTLTVSGSIKNVNVETVDGFTSEKTCLQAAQNIGSKISSQSINHLAAEGMNLDERSGKLAVFTDCQKVIK